MNKQQQQQQKWLPSEDLRRCVLAQDGKKSANLGNFIIKHAQAKFADIFGLEMKEVLLVPAARAGGNTRGG